MKRCDHGESCEACQENSYQLNERAQEIRGWAECAEDLLAMVDESGDDEEDRPRRVTLIAAVSGLLKLILGDTLNGAYAIESETSTRRKESPAPVGPMLVPEAS